MGATSDQDRDNVRRLLTIPRGRGRWLVLVGALALIAGIVEYAGTRSAGETIEALVGGALAGAVAALALSLAGTSWRGVVVGGGFVGTAMLSTTFLDRPGIVWTSVLIQGVLFALWSRPWLRNLRFSMRLGTAWLGVAYWLLGIVAALAIGSAGVGAQRLAYAGMLGLAVLAVLAGTWPAHDPTGGRDGATSADPSHPASGSATGTASGPASGTANGPASGTANGPANGPAGDDSRRATSRDLSAGIVVAFMLAIALLLLAGAGVLFDGQGPVPRGIGADQGRRFWGGDWLLYHPNSMAGLAVAVAIRVGVERAYAAWQRLAATALAGFVIGLTDSRTAMLFLGSAGVVHAVLLWRQYRTTTSRVSLPDYGTARRTLVAVATPFAVLLLVLVVSGGASLFQQRYAEGGVTSGRTATWGTVFTEWRGDSIAEKVFGHANDARATVNRGPKSEVAAADKLPTDNAAVGALRRGGVLGVLAFLVGLVLLVRHALNRAAPAWLTVAAVAALPTIATTDWLLGGTGGVLWILLVAGEAATALVLARSRLTRGAAAPDPAAPDPAAPPTTAPRTPTGTPADQSPTHGRSWRIGHQ
ncbi:MAG TPA: hypothetical protein VK453_12190 [Micromonosporaceae bacterium]|nr:hypothetical protein [Micromonosporaceae bacterium]